MKTKEHIMGMFDELHYDGYDYQTKDTPNQNLDKYKIENDQLWYQEYDSEWVEDEGLFGGHLKQFNERWVHCKNFTGTIHIYRENKEKGGWKNDRWIEYTFLFINGTLNSYDPGLSCVTPSSATGIEVEKDLVAEAPYHPGYEDAIVDGITTNWITEHLEYKKRHLETAKKIVEFIKR